MWRWLKNLLIRLFQRFLAWFRPNRNSRPQASIITSKVSDLTATSRIAKIFGICQPLQAPETPDIGAAALEALPLLPLQMILNKLDDKSLSNLSKTANFRLFKFSREEQIRRAQPLTNKACKLIARAAYKEGDEAKLKQLLKTPFVFLLKATVTTLSGRIVDATPYECALREGDPVLAKFIGDKMDALGLQEERVRQYQNVFPNGVIDQKAFNFSEVEKAVNSCKGNQNPDLLAAMHQQDNGSAFIQALTKFRKDFEAHVKAEKVVNYNHILEAWRIFDKNYSKWSSNQRQVWWCLIHGLTLKLSSARNAQNFLFGIYNLHDYRFKIEAPRVVNIANDFFLSELSQSFSYTGWGAGYGEGVCGFGLKFLKEYIKHTRQTYSACATTLRPRK